MIALNISVSLVYLTMAISLITLTMPIGSAMAQGTYNYIFLFEMLVSLGLLFMSAARLMVNLNIIKEQNGGIESFSQERRNVVLTACLFGLSMLIRIVILMLA